MRHLTESQWSSRSISTDDECDGFSVTTLAAAFWTKRAMFLDGEPYKTEFVSK